MKASPQQEAVTEEREKIPGESHLPQITNVTYSGQKLSAAKQHWASATRWAVTSLSWSGTQCKRRTSGRVWTSAHTSFHPTFELLPCSIILSPGNNLKYRATARNTYLEGRAHFICGFFIILFSSSIYNYTTLSPSDFICFVPKTWERHVKAFDDVLFLCSSILKNI